ncbi:MAG: hypothetical protein AB7H90_06920 [Alphaproteobacteria bacterium]
MPITTAIGEMVGEIGVFTNFPPEFPGHEGLRGGFGVLLEAPDGSTMTLQELEQYLGQDHLNWFQKATSINPPIPGLPPTFIDPPSGGIPGVWADARPWYFDEISPPPGTPYNQNRQLQVQGDPASSALNYFDPPHGQPPGTRIDFVTYLISDYSSSSSNSGTYKVLGGFSWSSQVQPDGLSRIVALDRAGPFQDEYREEILTEFGRYYDIDTIIAVSEPSTLSIILGAIMSVAMSGAASLYRARRSIRQ